ncbi:major facilitator superfamily transporter [Ceratobasidium sp. AG-Ba]|nr:major facilitator superfamily transporter [Ceratobasidium sp. AG-Ba]
MLIWGAISCLTGITHNFVGALLTRFFLGFVEAAFFPGALFLLSKWYKREELGLRTAILYCGNLSSKRIRWLIAAGILDGMEGKLGHAAWRWLFFIEGALTMAVAIAAIFILPDSRAQPDRSRYINEGAFHGFFLAIKDWKVWWLALALTAQVVGLSFNAYFPTLTATLGYNFLRAVALALINAFSQLGNIAGSYVWPSKWGKTYHYSYAICIACFGVAIIMCYAFRMHLITLNQRLDNGEVVEGMQERQDAMEEAAELEGVTVEEIRARRKGFRFAY